MKRFGFIGFGGMARHVLKVLEGYNGAVPELIGILETRDFDRRIGPWLVGPLSRLSP